MYNLRSLIFNVTAAVREYLKDMFGSIEKLNDAWCMAVSDINKCNDFMQNTCINSKIALNYSETAANCLGSAPMPNNFNYRKALVGRTETVHY